jgi:hypothetical protein
VLLKRFPIKQLKMVFAKFLLLVTLASSAAAQNIDAGAAQSGQNDANSGGVQNGQNNGNPADGKNGQNSGNAGDVQNGQNNGAIGGQNGPNNGTSGGQNGQNNGTSGGGWKKGKMTFFGGPLDKQSDPLDPKNKVNCFTVDQKFEDQFKSEVPQGMLAAFTDLMEEYEGPPCTPDPGKPSQCPMQGSCGQCYEVRCMARIDEQNGDAEVDGRKSCKPGSSVIVRVLDACPHNHPINIEKGNKNPCRAGENHIDLGHQAFELIADPKVGLILGEYRKVDCGQGLGRKNNGLKENEFKS